MAFFGLESFEQVQLAFRQAKIQLSEILSAFELMDERSQRMVHEVTKNKGRSRASTPSTASSRRAAPTPITTARNSNPSSRM